MKTVVVIGLCCLLLVSCSFSTTTVYRGLLQDDEQFTLYKIRIQRWGELRFSGLLALQRKTGGLFYAMLDSRGITLLEAEIGPEGECRLLQVTPKMRESSVPEYLSTVIYRLFGVDPEEYPCSRNWFLRFCFEAGAGTGWQKRATAGPFTVWEAEGQRLDTPGDGDLIYKQPWGGVTVSLKKVDQ